MNINLLKRTAAGASLVLAAAGLVLSFSTSASAEPTVTETGSTIGTIPLCDWTLKGVGSSITLENPAYKTLASNETKYRGLPYPLVGQTTDVEIFASSPTFEDSTTDEYNCSWYGTAVGGAVSITTGADPQFTSATTGNPADNSMGFLLSSSNKLVGLASIVGEACTDWTADSNADVFNSDTSSTPLALANDKTTSTSRCTYSIAYSTTIPADQNPTAPGVDYALVGPAMTTTLVVGGP